MCSLSLIDRSWRQRQEGSHQPTAPKQVRALTSAAGCRSSFEIYHSSKVGELILAKLPARHNPPHTSLPRRNRKRESWISAMQDHECFSLCGECSWCGPEAKKACRSNNEYTLPSGYLRKRIVAISDTSMSWLSPIDVLTSLFCILRDASVAESPSLWRQKPADRCPFSIFFILISGAYRSAFVVVNLSL